MLPWLFLAFTVVPVVEIALFIRVGGVIGTAPTIAVVLLTGLAGALLARSQGVRVMLDIQTALNEMRLPTTELLEGAIVLVGAATLLTPGFMTDALGLACLIPPSRKVLSRALGAVLAKRVQVAEDGRGGIHGKAEFRDAGNFGFRFGGVRPGPAHTERRKESIPSEALRDEGPIGRTAEPRTIEANFTVIDGGLED